MTLGFRLNEDRGIGFGFWNEIDVGGVGDSLVFDDNFFLTSGEGGLGGERVGGCFA